MSGMAKRLLKFVELSAQEILTLRDFRIWNLLIFAVVIISITIFIIIVIIVDVEQLVFAIFASVRTINHRDLCSSISPSCTCNDCRHTSPSVFACHHVDDCFRCWGSVVITKIHAFSSSSHFQPKPSGDGKTGLGTMSLFHTSSW